MIRKSVMGTVACMLIAAIACDDDDKKVVTDRPDALRPDAGADAAAPPAPPAQPPAVDTIAPDIPGVVAAGTTVEVIAENFNGTEGPLGLLDGTFVFTETNANRIVQIDADDDVSTFLENSNGSNGLGLDPEGRIVSVQTTPGQTRIGIIYPPGSEAVLTDNYQGDAYGRPNDLVVSTTGAVYFSEPGPNVVAGAPPPETPPLPPAVYYVPVGGESIRVAEGIPRPNGITLSRDESILYVNNTNGESLLAFDVQPDGTLDNQRDFAPYQDVTTNAAGTVVSGADGLAIDNDGRLYVAATSGVQVFDAEGAHLGTIPIARAPQNIAFAGPDKRTLYIVGRGAVWKLQTLAQGFTGRAK